MTKAELRQLIIEKLSGGDTATASRSKYHPVVVDKTIEAAYNDIVRAMTDSSKKNRTNVDMDNLVKPFYFTPQLDERRGQYYVESSFSPDKVLVRQVSQPMNRVNSFAFVSTTSEPMWDELEATKVDFTVGVMIENKRLYFDSLFQPNIYKNQIGEILVKMIPTYDGLSDTDDVDVSLQLILDAVFKFWQEQRPDDQVNDNNTEQVQGK
jgi:hypothetical protein